jgi:hypothetical protein
MTFAAPLGTMKGEATTKSRGPQWTDVKMLEQSSGEKTGDTVS